MDDEKLTTLITLEIMRLFPHVPKDFAIHVASYVVANATVGQRKELEAKFHDWRH